MSQEYKKTNIENSIQKIYLATDHAGFELKEKIADYLNNVYEFEIVDCGSYEYNDKDDYTDFIHKAGKELSENPQNISFVFGGSGEGEGMVMNRYAGVRCTTYYGDNLEIVELGRKHNDANAISFGARFVDYNECVKAVNIFLETDFEGGRHVARIKNIEVQK